MTVHAPLVAKEVNHRYIQEAVDETASQGGGTVQLPRGRFEIEQPIRIRGNNVTLAGEGHGARSMEWETGDQARMAPSGATILVAKGNFYAIEHVAPTYPVEVKGVRYLVSREQVLCGGVRDLTIDSRAAKGAIYTAGVTNPRYRDLMIFGGRVACFNIGSHAETRWAALERRRSGAGNPPGTDAYIQATGAHSAFLGVSDVWTTQNCEGGTDAPGMVIGSEFNATNVRLNEVTVVMRNASGRGDPTTADVGVHWLNSDHCVAEEVRVNGRQVFHSRSSARERYPDAEWAQSVSSHARAIVVRGGFATDDEIVGDDEHSAHSIIFERFTVDAFGFGLPRVGNGASARITTDQMPGDFGRKVGTPITYGGRPPACRVECANGKIMEVAFDPLGMRVGDALEIPAGCYWARLTIMGGHKSVSIGPRTVDFGWSSGWQKVTPGERIGLPKGETWLEVEVA